MCDFSPFESQPEVHWSLGTDKSALIIQKKEVGKNKGATAEVSTPVRGQIPPFLED